ncbi:hypothetical protein F8388_003047 [Cannabis sativa]|uniref:Pentatricopeptide repeat-containing protein n=1 Tax=Cannabis sativa TaxID=3483 RepID=A0A7J6HBE3_CANSA|nr:hypothetical protein F8388_003047 [Cannabis sativa]
MENFKPDEVTVTVALSACADLGELETREWIQACVRHQKGLYTDLCLRNSLINVYAKCGDVRAARRLFDSLQEKDVTTWMSMIAGHALHEQANEALNLFTEMKEARKYSKSSMIVPNDVTFLGVLMSCSHASLVEQGKHHFRSMMEDYGLKPRDPYFGCMVDLLCRANLVKEAFDFVSKMPICTNPVVWRTLLSACGIDGNVELGTQISSIEVSGSGISEFVATDDDHPLRSEIYKVLESLVVCMKGSYGYSLKISCLEDC